MDGVRLGRLSLRWDAAYCAVAAVLVLALSRELSSGFGVSAAIIAVAGVVVGAWAAFLAVAERRFELRTLLALVLIVNACAAVVVAASATLLPGLMLSLVLGAVALEVAAFAVSQGLALRRLS